MSITGLILQPSIIRGAALDYFRFMNNREVRVRVVQGGEPGGMAVLRMGEHTIKARIQGTSIPAGKNLFVRIEKDASGSYRLITLDKGSIPSPGLAAGTTTTIPAEVLSHFHAFMERARRRFAGGDKTPKGESAKTPSNAGTRETGPGKPIPDANLMESLARTVLADLPPGEERNLDGLMLLAWRDDSRREGAEEEPGESIVGHGNLSEKPRHYFVHADLRRLGPLGILLISPEQDFERFSIWLAPSRPATERLFQGSLQDWKNELRAGGLGLEELSILPAATADKNPGLDLRA